MIDGYLGRDKEDVRLLYFMGTFLEDIKDQIGEIVKFAYNRRCILLLLQMEGGGRAKRRRQHLLLMLGNSLQLRSTYS